jgi:hypothetical protein
MENVFWGSNTFCKEIKNIIPALWVSVKLDQNVLDSFRKGIRFDIFHLQVITPSFFFDLLYFEDSGSFWAIMVVLLRLLMFFSVENRT